MAGIRTCDRESQVQRPNHYTTEPPEYTKFSTQVVYKLLFRSVQIDATREARVRLILV